MSSPLCIRFEAHLCCQYSLLTGHGIFPAFVQRIRAHKGQGNLLERLEVGPMAPDPMTTIS
jgi:hypothetical protein